jgi:3-dehydroquinate synthase
MKTITVNLKERSYDIFIESNLLSKINDSLLKFASINKICIITDSNVAALYIDQINKALGFTQPLIIILNPGEDQKSLTTISMIYDRMLEYGIDRNITIVAFGGGVIGDISGFVAATIMRGIDFVQIPTTLLAQVDSSIGGKTGVNHRLGKNLIGAFHQPKRVFIDPHLLQTLPKREFLSGLIEVAKHGIILKPDLFDFIDKNLDSILNIESSILEELIESSCIIKAKIVSDDEKDNGIRAILNFGHTIGHAIEKITGFNKLLHGEAVGMGIIFESLLSFHKGLISSKSLNKIIALISRIISIKSIPELDLDNLMNAIEFDKKKIKDKPIFILPKAIGSVIINNDISRSDIAKTFIKFKEIMQS